MKVAFTGPDGPAGCNCGEVDVVVSLDRLKSQTLSLWSWPVTQAHHVHQADMEGHENPLQVTSMVVVVVIRCITVLLRPMS
jgi:hypothetical protein